MKSLAPKEYEEVPTAVQLEVLAAGVVLDAQRVALAHPTSAERLTAAALTRRS